MCGLKVLATTADGASTNQRFFRIHDSISSSDHDIPYRVINPYATDEWYLYFICDPPHLIKTVRNGLANSKRNLWVCAQVFLLCISIMYIILLCSVMEKS